MTAHARHPVNGHGCTARLAPASQLALDTLVRARGVAGAALLLGMSEATIDRLVFGGAARRDTVDRAEESIAFWRNAG